MSAVRNRKRAHNHDEKKVNEEHPQEVPMSPAFPWLELPTELRVKILAELSPPDLASCRETSKGTNGLIERYKRLMKRRVIRKIEISGEEDSNVLYLSVELNRKNRKKFEFSTNLDENSNEMPVEVASKRLRLDPSIEYSTPSTSRCETQIPQEFIEKLNSLLTDSNVESLELFELNLSDTLLNHILTIFQEKNSTLLTLDVAMCSLDDVTPEVLQKFIITLNPSVLRLRWLRHALPAHLSTVIVQGRKTFEVSSITDREGSLLHLSSLAPVDYLNLGCQSFHFDLSTQDQATKAIQQLITEHSQGRALIGPFYFGISDYKWCTNTVKSPLKVKVDSEGVKIFIKKQ